MSTLGEGIVALVFLIYFGVAIATGALWPLWFAFILWTAS